ncbi:MAG: CcmD family protein [Dehalococcoidia bacterium]|nr:MAG: CcmD family protein [Dehalococcoidia bacterium]
MDDLSYLFAAYTVIWVGLFAYILVLAQKQRQLRRDMDRLKETMKKEAE